MYYDVHLLGKCKPFRFNFIIIHEKILYKLGVKFHHIKNDRETESQSIFPNKICADLSSVKNTHGGSRYWKKISGVKKSGKLALTPINLQENTLI